MANGISYGRAFASCLPFIGPFVSLTYSAETSRQFVVASHQGMPQQDYDFNFFQNLRENWHRKLECGRGERIVLLNQMCDYAKYGIVSTLFSLAAIVAGVASCLLTSPFLIGSLSLGFGFLGIVLGSAFLECNDVRQEPVQQAAL